MKISEKIHSIDPNELKAKKKELNREITILTLCNCGLYFAWYLMVNQHSAKMDVQENGEYSFSYLAVLLGAVFLTLWLWISLVIAFVRRLKLQ
jgi:hypothetical protein